MRPLGAWLGRLAMAGSCLAWAGCGGSDVPDPDSDASAATEQAPRPVDKSAEVPAPDAPEPATPVAAAGPAKAAEAPALAATSAEKPVTPADPPAEGEKLPAAAKGDASGTEDLLRLAGSTPPPPGDAPAPATPPPGTAAPSPASSPGPAMTPAAMAPGSVTPGQVSPGSPPPPGQGGQLSMLPPPSMPAPGVSSPGGARPGDDEAMRNRGPTTPPPGLAPPSPGGMMPPPAAGGAGGDADLGELAKLGNAAYNHPISAVQAFLAALKAKDKDKLSQATARRAATESDEKHHKIFAAIIDGSISDEELDDMAVALDGFRPVTQLQAKSTGRIGIVITKQSGRDTLRRTIMARKEKEGWKVLDIENMYEFKANNLRYGRRRR